MKAVDIEVIAVISNPADYESRYRLYRAFEFQFNNQRKVSFRLWTIELQHGQRSPQVTVSGNEQHLQLWTSALPGEIWHKENLLNIAINYITSKVPDWRRVCWTDADFLWEDDAFAKILRSLDHYDVVQCWSHLVNLAPKGGIIANKIGTSFMWGLKHNEPPPDGQYPKWIGSPGGAWAARRDSINKLGSVLGSPLIDWGILGAGDMYFACALVGLNNAFLDKRFHPNYRNTILQYESQAVDALKKNIGYVENTVRHMFHGRVADRQYETRGAILVKYQFDPMTDVKRDVSGVLQLVVQSDRQIGLRDACRRYFFTRNEDASTL
jgi:hypothetical protein